MHYTSQLWNLILSLWSFWGDRLNFAVGLLLTASWKVICSQLIVFLFVQRDNSFQFESLPYSISNFVTHKEGVIRLNLSLIIISHHLTLSYIKKASRPLTQKKDLYILWHDQIVYFNQSNRDHIKIKHDYYFLSTKYGIKKLHYYMF